MRRALFVAHAFIASSEFAIDKPAGTPCPNLDDAFRCSIHADLRGRGFSGCAAYDCFGAGQAITERTVAGADWRADPDGATEMFRAFEVLRSLHELRWHVRWACAVVSPPDADDLTEVADRLAWLGELDAASLLGVDVEAIGSEVAHALRRVSAAHRSTLPGPRRDLSRASLIGRDLTAVDLRAADLRGASLVGADLSGCDLAGADLAWADIRGAGLRGADLSRSLFLTQQQVDGCTGDAATGLPAGVGRPPHWSR